MRKKIKLQNLINEKLSTLFDGFTYQYKNDKTKRCFIEADIYHNGVKNRHCLRVELHAIDKSVLKKEYTDNELMHYCMEIVNLVITGEEGRVFDEVDFHVKDDEGCEDFYATWCYDMFEGYYFKIY